VESTLLEKIALVEANSSKWLGFLKDIGTVTGLTQDQIRYHCGKPMYQLYLERMRKELAREIVLTKCIIQM
jgi:hypothetical protein